MTGRKDQIVIRFKRATTGIELVSFRCTAYIEDREVDPDLRGNEHHEVFISIFAAIRLESQDECVVGLSVRSTNGLASYNETFSSRFRILYLKITNPLRSRTSQLSGTACR